MPRSPSGILPPGPGRTTTLPPAGAVTPRAHDAAQPAAAGDSAVTTAFFLAGEGTKANASVTQRPTFLAAAS